MNTPWARNPKVIELSCGPATTRTAMMKSSAGNTITTSISRETTVSTQPRK